MLINHKKMELFFAFFLMNCTKEHAAGFNAHHRSGGKIGDGDECFADKLFGLIESMNAAENCAFIFRAVIKSELQELFTLGNCNAFLNLNGSEIGFAEGFKINGFFKQRFDFNL